MERLMVTREQMIKCVNEIHHNAFDINDDVSVDDVYDLIAQDIPYHIKNLLKSLIREVYGSGDEFLRVLRNTVQERDKEKNLEYFRNYVFIDGVGYRGQNMEQLDNDMNDDEDSYHDSEPDIRKKVFPMEDYLDGGYQPDIDNEQVPPTPPVQDNFYTSYSTPNNLEDAARLYNSIMGSIVYINDNISKGENKCKLPGGAEVSFETTADNYVTDGFAVIVRDRIGFKIEGVNNIDLNFMLVSGTGRVAMIGELVKIDNWYYISTSVKNINFKLMRKSEYMYSLVFKDGQKNIFYSMDIAVNFQPYIESKNEAILCIDFGTSNTTAGFFDPKSNGKGEIELVDFVDVTAMEYKTSKLCPTLVYIDKINFCDEDLYDDDSETNKNMKIDYLFGFDAQKVLIESGYNPKGDVFFEIKRWMVSSNEEENIRDGRRRATVKKLDIISEYLHYILEQAQNCFKRRFKRLHFSAPVKLKKVFIDKIAKYIFTEKDGFQVLSAEESVDEAISIVYKYISDRVLEYERASNVYERENVPNDKTILVLDCGGGTTDVASCHYKFKKVDTFYNVELSPKFVNGNPNFGGNNITYRIFQLLKIRLANYYLNNDSSETASNLDISTLISEDQNEILGSIDDSISEGKRITVYDKLDRASKESEKVIPTDFNGDSVYAKSENNKKNTKMNFYYLWQLAESTKLTFFEKAGRLSFKLPLNLNAIDEKEKVVMVDSSSNVFYIANENNPGSMKLVDKVPDIEIKINEISAVVAPEIYYLLASVNAFENEDYFRIKLTGQSCKISLFSELLKEFIPGKKLRMRERQNYEQKVNYSERLKLECVYGSILYTRDKIFQGIRSSINRVSQKVIYDLVLSRGNIGTKETVLFKGDSFKERRNKNGEMQLSAFPLNIETYNLSDGNGMILKVYNTLCNMEKAEPFKTDPLAFSDGTDDEIQVNLESDITEDNDKTKVKIPSLKRYLLVKAYYNLENCKVYEDGEVSERSLLDRLVLDIKEKLYGEDGSDKLESKRLVFGVPNSDGYGFILYQLISKYDENGNRVYFCSGYSRSFESGETMQKTFFSGNNCGDI